MRRGTGARRRGIAAVAVALVVAPFATAPAVAADASIWWFDVYGVGQAQAEGWTGDGVKVAVIDAAINPDLPVFSGRDLTIADGALCQGYSPTGTAADFGTIHGTTIAATLIGNGTGAGAVRGIAPDAEVTFYGYGAGRPDDETCAVAQYDGALSAFGLGVQRALDDGAQIITTSVLGNVTPDDIEVVANAVARGVIVVSATSNPDSSPVVSLRTDAQMTLNGVVAVSAVDRNGDLQQNADGTPYVTEETTVVAAGTDLPAIGAPDGGWESSFTTAGSSFAAPLVAGMLAVAAQRYPDATANQLLQSLLRTTGGEEHEPEYDAATGYGYGAAWLSSLLAADPARLPDENPLMNKESDSPTVQQVAAAAERGSTYPLPARNSFSEYGEDAQGAPSPAVDLAPVLIATFAGLGLVVIGGIVTIVIVARKKSRHQGGTV